MQNNTGGKLRIALTGATGLVGSRVIELLKDDFHFFPLSQEEMDITDGKQVRQKLGDLDFDVFLHLAAYTNVNKAEEEKELCRKINIEGTKNVFAETVKKKKLFVLISTEFVFNGTSEKMIFDEESKANPLGVYGASKYEAEKIVKDKAMIVRLSHPYRSEYPDRQDFARTIKNLLKAGKKLSMITDSLITPTFIDDIAYGLRHLLLNFSQEIFHLVGSTFLSPYTAGKLIARTFGIDEEFVQPTTFADYFKKFSKTRPKYTPIISNKNDFYPMKSFEEGIERVKKQLTQL